MNSRISRLFLACLFAIGLSGSGVAAAAAHVSPHVTTAVRAQVGVPHSLPKPQAGDQQTGESTNDNVDQKDAANHDDGQQGQAGDQQTGDSVNDNVDQKDSGNHNDAQQGQAAGQ